MTYQDYMREKFKSINADYPTNEAEGYPCILERSAGKSLVDYKIYGDSIQNGNPTPDNPIELLCVGDKTSNICPDNVTKWESGQWAVATPDKTANPSRYRLVDLLPCEENTTYYVNTNVSVVFRGYSSDLSVARNIGVITREFTTGMSETYLGVFVFSDTYTNSAAWKTAFANGEVNICISKDAGILTKYEPYGYKIPIVVQSDNLSEPFVTTNIYLNEPLRKLTDYYGTHEDYIDYKRGVVVRRVGCTELSGVNWTMYTDVQPDVLGFYYSNSNIARTSSALCNIFIRDSADIGAGGSLKVNTERIYVGVGVIKLSVAKNRGVNDASSLKTFLKSKKAYAVYLLKTAVEEAVKLPRISTFKGINTISTATEISPSNIWCKYFRN